MDENLIKEYKNINEFKIRKKHRIWNIYKTKNNSQEKYSITKNITQIRDNKRNINGYLIVVIDLYSKILSENEVNEINNVDTKYYLPYMRPFTQAKYDYEINYYALGTSSDYNETNYPPFQYISESYTELLCTYEDKYFTHLHIEHVLYPDFVDDKLITPNSLEWTKDSLSTLKCMVKGGLSDSEYIDDRLYHDKQRLLTLMSIGEDPVFDGDSDGFDDYEKGSFVLYYSDLPYFITNRLNFNDNTTNNYHATSNRNTSTRLLKSMDKKLDALKTLVSKQLK